MKSPTGSFPAPARCAQGGKRQLHGAPLLQLRGLRAGRHKLRVRAGLGGRGRVVQGARARTSAPARGKPAKGAGARRLAPPPAPSRVVPRPAPRPFLFPRKEGRGAKPVRVAAPAQAQCFTQPRGGERRAALGLTSAALRPAAKR